jgi:diaminohydroxyphosphoribosylaminopyrimidine deaminase/5-amino-6-(5-phosphoribosylamino)uracil reductase
VTWKFATTLDGRSAAADGTSRWVSQRAARATPTGCAALCDVMLVGTNTVAVDDPSSPSATRRPAAPRASRCAR